MPIGIGEHPGSDRLIAKSNLINLTLAVSSNVCVVCTQIHITRIQYDIAKDNMIKNRTEQYTESQHIKTNHNTTHILLLIVSMVVGDVVYVGKRHK